MIAMRREAEQKIAWKFSAQPTDAAHARKRIVAEQVASGGAVPLEFDEAADIEGMSPATLAAHILSMPDELITRDNQRRRLVIAVRAAADPTALAQILLAAGI